MADEIKILGKLQSVTTEGIIADSQLVKYKDTDVSTLLDSLTDSITNINEADTLLGKDISAVSESLESLVTTLTTNLNLRVLLFNFLNSDRNWVLRLYTGTLGSTNSFITRILASYDSGDSVFGNANYASTAGLYLKYLVTKTENGNATAHLMHGISKAIADTDYVHTDLNFTTELNLDLTSKYVWEYTANCGSNGITDLCTGVTLKAGDVVEFELKDYLGSTTGWGPEIQLLFSKDGTLTADSFFLWSSFSIGTVRALLTADADTVSVGNGADATVKFSVRKLSKMTLLLEFYDKLLYFPVYKLKSIKGTTLFGLTTSASSSEVIAALTSYIVMDVDWSTGLINQSTGTNIGDGTALTKDDLIAISKNGYFLYDADTKTNINVNYDGAYFNFVELSRTAANAQITLKSIIIKITDAGVYSVAKAGSSVGIFPYDTGVAMLSLVNTNTLNIDANTSNITTLTKNATAMATSITDLLSSVTSLDTRVTALEGNTSDGTTTTSSVPLAPTIYSALLWASYGKLNLFGTFSDYFSLGSTGAAMLSSEESMSLILNGYLAKTMDNGSELNFKYLGSETYTTAKACKSEGESYLRFILKVSISSTTEGQSSLGTCYLLSTVVPASYASKWGRVSLGGDTGEEVENVYPYSNGLYIYRDSDTATPSLVIGENLA